MFSYLKNVMVRLMQFDSKEDERKVQLACSSLNSHLWTAAQECAPVVCCQALYPAIATILHFGPEVSTFRHPLFYDRIVQRLKLSFSNRVCL